MRRPLGDASPRSDYDTIKKRVSRSRYTMSFLHGGVNFDLTVVSSDSVSRGYISLVKVGPARPRR